MGFFLWTPDGSSTLRALEVDVSHAEMRPVGVGERVYSSGGKSISVLRGELLEVQIRAITVDATPTKIRQLRSHLIAGGSVAFVTEQHALWAGFPVAASVDDTSVGPVSSSFGPWVSALSWSGVAPLSGDLLVFDPEPGEVNDEEVSLSSNYVATVANVTDPIAYEHDGTRLLRSAGFWPHLTLADLDGGFITTPSGGLFHNLDIRLIYSPTGAADLATAVGAP